MKSVVIFSAFLTPFRSGAEACAEEVALALCDQFDITIITAKMRSDLPRKDLLQGKIPIIRVGLGLPIDKWLYPFLAPFAARKLKPDVLHAVLETFAGVALHMCNVVIPKAKQILTLQTTNRNFLRGHIMRSPDTVTAISRVLALQARTYGRNDVIVIPNGIQYRALRDAAGFVQRVKGRILFVGRLEKMKGVNALIEAFSMVHAKNADATLRIVGDGSLRHQLEARVMEEGLLGCISFAGFVPASAIADEYAAADIFCGLSRSEALGNVFLEAQAAGCAVVATNVGGIPEIIQHEQTGLLVPSDDPVLAAEALERLLRDGALRTALAQAGMHNAEQYDWKGIAERYAALYQA